MELFGLADLSSTIMGIGSSLDKSEHGRARNKKGRAQIDKLALVFNGGRGVEVDSNNSSESLSNSDPDFCGVDQLKPSKLSPSMASGSDLSSPVSISSSSSGSSFSVTGCADSSSPIPEFPMRSREKFGGQE
ncbi:hypothetical protein Fot_28156 [Forsythia ovata]|uniref:Uncharacterized protein n=1 Tax=Forsythia ovata TaxID=205694 RepID=A0ABD1TN71_9LAMI